ncbi:MAG TPA: TlpA disulfide reductase family protein [Candidatus Humimicrobiaceae bacterium]
MAKKNFLNRDKKMKKYFIIITTIILMTSVVFLFSGCKVSGNVSSSDGNFTLTDLEGNPVSLSDFKGNIVVLNFWATWCPPCREEIPDFVKVFNEFRDKDVQFIGVSNEDISTLKRFAADYGINYPILVDDKNIMAIWGIRAIPTTFVFDRDGRIVFENVGMMTREQIRNVIENVL